MKCWKSNKEYGDVHTNATTISTTKVAASASRARMDFVPGAQLKIANKAGNEINAALYLVDVASPAVRPAIARSVLAPDSESRTTERKATSTMKVMGTSVTP